MVPLPNIAYFGSESRRDESLFNVLGKFFDLVYRADPYGRIVWISASVSRLGYSVVDVIGRDATILYASESDYLTSRQAFSAGLVVRDYPVRLRAKGGEHLLGQLSVCTMPDLGTVEVIRDTTTTLQQQEQRQKYRDELAHALRLATMGELAAGLAHELNQPLAAIVNYALGCRRITRDPGQDAAARLEEALGEIQQQALRAGQIIQRLRGFVRREEPRRAPVNMNDQVNRAFGFLELECREVSVRVQLDLMQDLPPVLGDPIQISQVVLNLLRNALDAVREEGASQTRAIYVHTEVKDSNVVLSVRDTGVEVPSELAERVFDAFFTTKTGGLGLGLSISRAIAEAHAGRLWMQSDPKTFYFELPCFEQSRRDEGG